MRSTSMVVAALGLAVAVGGAALLRLDATGERDRVAAVKFSELCEAYAFADQRRGLRPDPCPRAQAVPGWYQPAGYGGLAGGMALLALGLAMRRDATRDHD